MFAQTSARSTLRRLASVAVTAGLVVTMTPGGSSADHTGAEPGPIHAGNTFGWYRHGVTRYEFKGGLEGFWKRQGPGTVRTQHGMLTLNTAKRGTVSATLGRPGHRTGRWEIRLRQRRYETKHTNYRVVTELVPAGTRDQHCGGRDIALHNFAMGTNRAKFYIHTLPNNSFRAFKGMNLGNEQWHTFAVEVTERRISWFVDAHVVRSERRAEALKNVPMTVRFSMRGVPGKRMNKSRMQMDWLRYWQANSPNKLSTKAPATTLTSYNQAC